MSAGGSPPQVRGKHHVNVPPSSGNRITPAGAGKTKATLNERFVNQDHPRRCGENNLAKVIQIVNIGSPPQVRGKPLCCRYRDLRSRITPAGAGKTHTMLFSTEIYEDHPRRCGENNVRKDETDNEAGSPPQVRGKPLHNTA